MVMRASMNGPSRHPTPEEDRAMVEAAEALLQTVRRPCARLLPHQRGLDLDAATLSAAHQSVLDSPEGMRISVHPLALAYMLGTVFACTMRGETSSVEAAGAFIEGMRATDRATTQPRNPT